MYYAGWGVSKEDEESGLNKTIHDNNNQTVWLKDNENLYKGIHIQVNHRTIHHFLMEVKIIKKSCEKCGTNAE